MFSQLSQAFPVLSALLALLALSQLGFCSGISRHLQTVDARFRREHSRDEILSGSHSNYQLLRVGPHQEKLLARLRGGGELEVVSAHGRADDDEPIRLSAFTIIRRAVLLLLVFSFPLATILPAAFLGSFREYIWFPMLGWSIGHSGAAFIKWGQWASVRPDMFPEALCDVLSRSDFPTLSSPNLATCSPLTLHCAVVNSIFQFARVSPAPQLGLYAKISGKRARLESVGVLRFIRP